MITEETIEDVLIIWDVDGADRVPLAFFNNGDQEATVKAWRRDGGLDILTVWLTLPRTRCWRVEDHVEEPLPFGRYRVDVKIAETLWWTDSVTGSKLSGLDGSSRTRRSKVLRTARIVIG